MNAAPPTVTITVQQERSFGRRFALPGEIIAVPPDIAREAIDKGWAIPGRQGDGRPRVQTLELPPRRRAPGSPQRSRRSDRSGG